MVPMSTFLSEARSQRYAAMFCASMHELAEVSPAGGEVATGGLSSCVFRGESGDEVASCCSCIG